MNNSNRSVWRTDSALRQYMYFIVMSQHTIHYYMNINELRQCCFDSGDSLTGFVLQPVSLISMASVVQTRKPPIVGRSTTRLGIWPWGP